MDTGMNGHEARMMAAQPNKTGFRILAYISALLGLAGVVLPLLPTTSFVLLAAFFASKGSPAFALWLEQHPAFGPAIEQWRAPRAIPLKPQPPALGTLALRSPMLLALPSPPPLPPISPLRPPPTPAYPITR